MSSKGPTGPKPATKSHKSSGSQPKGHHSNAPVAVGVSGNEARPNPGTVTHFTRDSCEITFREILESGVMVPVNTAGENLVVFTRTLDLSALSGTRVGTEAQLWEYYRFKNLKIKVISGASTTAGGTLLLAFEPDPSDVVASLSAAAMRALTSQQASKIFSSWQTAEIDVRPARAMDWLFTNPGVGVTDPRLVEAGRVTLARLSSANAMFQVLLEISGTVEFKTKNYQPALIPASVGTSSTTISWSASAAVAGTIGGAFLYGFADPSVAPSGGQVVSPVPQPLEAGEWGLKLPRGTWEIVLSAANAFCSGSGGGSVGAVMRRAIGDTSGNVLSYVIDTAFSNGLLGSANPGYGAGARQFVFRIICEVAPLLGGWLVLNFSPTGDSGFNLGLGKRSLIVQRTATPTG